MALVDVIPHLTWAWRYSCWRVTLRGKGGQGKPGRPVWWKWIFRFPSPFSGTEPRTCPGVLVRWSRTHLIMFLTQAQPMEWQTLWCHRLSQVSHWADATLALWEPHATASEDLVLLGCIFKNINTRMVEMYNTCYTDICWWNYQNTYLANPLQQCLSSLLLKNVCTF